MSFRAQADNPTTRGTGLKGAQAGLGGCSARLLWPKPLAWPSQPSMLIPPAPAQPHMTGDLRSLAESITRDIVTDSPNVRWVLCCDKRADSQAALGVYAPVSVCSPGQHTTLTHHTSKVVSHI